MFGMVLHLNVIQAMFEGDGGQSSQSQDEKEPTFTTVVQKNTLLQPEINMLQPTSSFRKLNADIAFNALTLLAGRQEGHPACKKT